MPRSNGSSHDTFDLDDLRATALDVDDNRLSWPHVRCCGCFCLSWARRWETGLRTADLENLERRQKALEWSSMMSSMDSASESMPSHASSLHSKSLPSHSVHSASDGLGDWAGSEASSTAASSNCMAGGRSNRLLDRHCASRGGSMRQTESVELGLLSREDGADGVRGLV